MSRLKRSSLAAVTAILAGAAAARPARPAPDATVRSAPTTTQAPAPAAAATLARAIDWNAYQDETLLRLQEYLRIDTSNPPGNEARAAEFFKRLFDGADIPNRSFPYAPGRGDFYAVLKGDGSLRPLVLLSHTDVVRAAPENWKVPPFSGEIRDGELYGRGAIDMKDQGLMNAEVMLIAAREHLPLKRDLIFLATADEEVDDTGSQWLIANHPELVENAEYLITEGGSNLILPGRGTFYGIDVAEKAPFWLRLTATGPGGHGSIPIADSAPNRLIRALGRVVAWETPVHLLPSAEEYFHRIAVTEPEPLATEYRNIRESIQNPEFARMLGRNPEMNFRIRDTVSLTGLEGSAQTNVIPDRASARLDVRLLPGDNPQQFLAELRAVIDDDEIEIEPINNFRTPNSSPTDTALYRIIESVVHAYSPHAIILPVLDSGYTESQMFRPLGIVCYGFLPVELKPEVQASEHASNERIPVDQVRRGVKMYYDVIARAANE